MTLPAILIAGIGNIFMGDDAFGSEVARRLGDLNQWEGVEVVDFGIRGLDLAYALADRCDVAILIDATAQNSRPGTLHVMELELDAQGGSDNQTALTRCPFDGPREGVAIGARDERTGSQGRVGRLRTGRRGKRRGWAAGNDRGGRSCGAPGNGFSEVVGFGNRHAE